MAAHTSPVALHLLSSYIAAGFVPQLPGNTALIQSRASFDPLNPTSSLQNTPGIGFQSIPSLMTTSAAANILHSQAIATSAMERNDSVNLPNTQDFNTSINPSMIRPTQSGFAANFGLNMNMPASGISSGQGKVISNDIKRPIPHLPQKSSGIGIS